MHYLALHKHWLCLLAHELCYLPHTVCLLLHIWVRAQHSMTCTSPWKALSLLCCFRVATPVSGLQDTSAYDRTGQPGQGETIVDKLKGAVGMSTTSSTSQVRRFADLDPSPCASACSLRISFLCP